ncbi:MAG: 3-oxoadipate enol-lactonase [Pseudomonadota bacterium]
MAAFNRAGTNLHYAVDGDPNGSAIVFSNSLGTDFRIWNQVVARLPDTLRIVRYDKRGHGLSDLGQTPWGMAGHVADLAGLLDHLDIKDAVVCGLSVGGMITQGLAAGRPDLVKAMILCDTGARIGTPDMWQDRVEIARTKGLEAMADAVMERWFTAEFRANDPSFPIWRNMLCRTTPEGYAGTCQAIADTDLIESTSRLRLPCLGLCGDKDLATPPDLVRETVSLVPGSMFNLIRNAGHVPCVEQPDATAEAIRVFLGDLGVV